MGCTEVPLGLQGSAAVAGLNLVDPAQVLGRRIGAPRLSRLKTLGRTATLLTSGPFGYGPR